MKLRIILVLALFVGTFTAMAERGVCNGQRQRARLRDGSCLGVAQTNRWCGQVRCPGPAQCPNWDLANPCLRFQQCPRNSCRWMR